MLNESLNMCHRLDNKPSGNRLKQELRQMRNISKNQREENNFDIKYEEREEVKFEWNGNEEGEDTHTLTGGGKAKRTSKYTSNKSSKRKSTNPSKAPVITPVIKSIKNVYIYIRYNKDSSNDDPLSTNRVSQNIQYTLNRYVIEFLRHMNFAIAAHTNVNYHLLDNRQLYIRIPVYPYTNDEAKLHPLDLILKRVDSIRSFIESYDFSTDTKSAMWLIRTLTSLGVNLNEDFNLTVDCDDFDYKKIDEPLTFNFPAIEYPHISKHVLSDSSIVTVYEDPYFNDYGVYINLSVPFADMGMSYNGLHIYEHLMTKGWDKLSVNDQIYANGITYPNGICMVFNILSTESAYHEYTNAALKWLFKIRDPKFWQDSISDDILLETCRTISETRTERTLASMGRSDLHAYTNNYNRSIFEYWSNQPFTLLLTCPSGTAKLNVEAIEKMMSTHPLRHIPRPENVKMKYYPLEVMLMKQVSKLYILKADTERIKNAIMKPRLKTKVYFGVDCYMGQDEDMDDNDLSEFNGVLHPLLYLNRYFTEKELREFVRTHITAASSSTLSMQSMCIRHAADSLEELNLNL